MGEERQQRDTAREMNRRMGGDKDKAYTANIQEVSGASGTRTFLIDCSRKVSNKYEAVGGRASVSSKSAWENKCNGFNVKRGDQISIEAVCINSEGAGANTIELNPGKVPGKIYTGNKVILEMGFTLTNNGRYSQVLPVKPPTCVANQAAGGAANPFTVDTLQPPQTLTAVGQVSNVAPAANIQLCRQGVLPVANDYGIPANNSISQAMCNQTPLVSSAAWGWTGYSRDKKNCDGNYSLFRNKFYPGITGKTAPGGGALSQSNPWLINSNLLTAAPTIPAGVAPPTNPYNNAAAATAAPGYSTGQMWSGMNPQAGNDNLPYIMTAPDFQPFMGLPPNNQWNGGGNPPINQYPINPANGRREPPKPEPLKAFVVIDLQDYQFIDVNLLASLITQAFRQTDNVYRWDKIADVEHSLHPPAAAGGEKQNNSIPYGTKFGNDPIVSGVRQLDYIWDSVYPTFTGALYKTIPANFWLGCNMEAASPDNLGFHENQVKDWLWCGSGTGDQGGGAIPIVSAQFPDTSNPAGQEAFAVGRQGTPYVWNNQIYGNMACRDFERWEMMFHFFYGDIYDLHTDQVGNEQNIKRTILLNTQIKSIVIKVPNGTGAGGQSGGQAGQNVGTSGGTATTPDVLGFNIHEVSCIGSEQTDPAQDDFTGNMIYTNMEYTEYNVKRFAELFPKGEIYLGDETGYEDMVNNDPKNFSYMLDCGVCNDALTSCINTDPIKGLSTAPTGAGVPTTADTSYDASARFSIITPLEDGVYSRTTYANGGNTGWFGRLNGNRMIQDLITPPTSYTQQWGTFLDHTQVNVGTGVADPQEIDRYHLCPSYTMTGLGGDGAAVGKGRSIGRIQVNSRYWNDWKEDVIWARTEFSPAGLSVPGSCDLSPATLEELDDSLSRKYGVGAFPYKWFPDGTQPAQPKILIAFRVSKKYFPQPTPDNTGVGIATDPMLVDLTSIELGRLEYKNFLGISNSFNDNPACVPMNSDDQRKTYFGGRTAAGFSAMPEDAPWNYQNYINIGATNASCEFNSDKARFEFTYFYTPQTLSAAYQTANNKGAAGIAQGGTEVAIINEEGLSNTASTNPAGSSIKFYDRQISGNIGGAAGQVNVPCDGVGINDTMSGVFINKVWLVKPDTEIPSMEKLNDFYDKTNLFSTQNNYLDMTKDWIEATPDQWEGNILDRMGYSYYDIFPPLGSNKNRFNEFTYASQAPQVCNQSKKPGTMNSKTNIANALFLDAYFNSQVSPPPATEADIVGLPLYGLGQNGFIQVNQIADSPAIRASNLPQLFDTPYYLIQTTGLVEPEQWIGLNGIIQPTIYYCMKNYSQSDFFYGYASTYSLMAEKDHPVGSIHTEIRRPDTGELVPLGDNSSVIYKITRKLEIPPIITTPLGEPIETPEQPPNKDTQLLQELVDLMKLQVRPKEGNASLIPFRKGQIGSGGGGRQEGISNPMDETNPIGSIGNMGGGGLQGLADMVRRTANNDGQREAINIINPARAEIPAMMREMDLTEEEIPGMFATLDKPEDVGEPPLPAPMDIPEPWLRRAIAEVGLPQTEIQAIEMNELDEAQREADRLNPEGSQFRETSRRMRLIFANRNNPFNPALEEVLEGAGDPRREAQEEIAEGEGAGEGVSLLTQVEQQELRTSLVEHLIRTRLATILTRDPEKMPDVGVLQRAIKQVLAGSINNINQIVGIVSMPPTGETYEQMYQVLSQTFPEYPVFFSATTGRKLVPSQAKQSFEVGSSAVGISDEGLKQLTEALLDDAARERRAGRNIATYGFPPDQPGRPAAYEQDFNEVIRGNLGVIGEADQMRVLDRPEGFVGRYDEGVPSVLWALTPPKEPYGSKDPTILSDPGSTMAGTDTEEAKEGARKYQEKKEKIRKSTRKKVFIVKDEEGNVKQRIEESDTAKAKRLETRERREKRLEGEYRKTHGVQTQHEATHHSSEARARALEARQPPTAPYLEQTPPRAVQAEGEGEEIPMATPL